MGKKTEIKGIHDIFGLGERARAKADRDIEKDRQEHQNELDDDFKNDKIGLFKYMLISKNNKKK